MGLTENQNYSDLLNVQVTGSTSIMTEDKSLLLMANAIEYLDGHQIMDIFPNGVQ